MLSCSKYTIVDMEKYTRKEHFKHYLNDVPATFSLCSELNITNLINKGYKLYPTLIYLVIKTCNLYSEFRMSLNENGQLIVFDKVHPSYTIFHNESETFSCLWTWYNDDYNCFLENYKIDLNQYTNDKSFLSKKKIPLNVINISMIPWRHFSGFNLNLSKGYKYLLPIFTFGKFKKKKNQVFIPLSIQVHHAVCDGYHVSRFFNSLEEQIISF